MCVFFQRAHPKSDQEENELVMASLRHLYEERQRCHQHVATGDYKQVTYQMHLFDHASLKISTNIFISEMFSK